MEPKKTTEGQYEFTQPLPTSFEPTSCVLMRETDQEEVPPDPKEVEFWKKMEDSDFMREWCAPISTEDFDEHLYMDVNAQDLRNKIVYQC